LANEDGAVTGSAAAPMLATRGLVSGYGRVETLHGVDIEAPRGQITTVIGPNGSGKSTLLKTAAGLVRTWRAPPCWRERTSPAARRMPGSAAGCAWCRRAGWCSRS